MFDFLKRRFGPKNQITVQFIYSDSGKVFSQTHSPLEQLPASFETHTTVEVMGVQWEIVKAEPLKSADALRDGILKLWVRKLQKVNPADLLYSLPTINDGLPKASKPLTGASIFRMTEDDWRQAEFISTRFKSQIDKTHQDIQRVWDEQKVGIGFKNLHVRVEIPHPLSGTSLTYGSLSEKLGATVLGLSFQGWDDVVDGGFAIPLGEGHTIYGQRRGDAVVMLGIHPGSHPSLAAIVAGEPRAETLSPGRIELLKSIAEDHDLCLVDWFSFTTFQPYDLAAFFRREAPGEAVS